MSFVKFFKISFLFSFSFFILISNIFILFSKSCFSFSKLLLISFEFFSFSFWLFSAFFIFSFKLLIILLWLFSFSSINFFILLISIIFSFKTEFKFSTFKLVCFKITLRSFSICFINSFFSIISFNNLLYSSFVPWIFVVIEIISFCLIFKFFCELSIKLLIKISQSWIIWSKTNL